MILWNTKYIHDYEMNCQNYGLEIPNLTKMWNSELKSQNSELKMTKCRNWLKMLKWQNVEITSQNIIK